MQSGTSEIYSGTGDAFIRGDDLPDGLLLDEHCMAKVDEDTVALIGT